MKTTGKIRKAPMAALLAVAAAAAMAAQAAPRLRVTSPVEGSYLAGTVRLLAEIEPAATARDVTRVTFFADGTQVCSPAAPPFACDWDAGERIRAHQIRAVAALRDGTRLVATVLTRTLEYVETVDVDLVQVTAVVTDDQGRFVSGLTQKDFVVAEDGRPQRISN